MSIIKTEKVSYTYPQVSSIRHATIENVSFSINSGETLGIIGHTGSGKSTLLQTLNGLIKPNSGTVFLNKEDFWQNTKNVYEKRFKVGLVFQYPEYQLFEETVYKDIAYGPKNMGLSDEEINLRVKTYANLLGLNEGHLNKSPFDISGGEKRRVALAGILAIQPQVLVLDEPTAGLDPKGREMLFKAVKEYQQRTNAAVIIVSHSMEDLAVLCDKLLVMSEGKVKMFGAVSEVFARADELKKMGLDVPMVTKILLSLKEKGVNIKTDAFTVEDAVKSIVDALNRGEINA